MFLTGTERPIKGHCHLKQQKRRDQRHRLAHTKMKPPKLKLFGRGSSSSKMHSVCSSSDMAMFSSSATTFNHCLHVSPRITPSHSNLSPRAVCDRTAVPHLCLPLIFQEHFPTSFAAQPPLSASERLRGLATRESAGEGCWSCSEQ